VDARFRCPCCGYKTLETAGALALCPVCWWEDDGQEDSDAGEVRLTVNGALSLDEARQHFARPIPAFCLTFASRRSLSSNVPFAVLFRAPTAVAGLTPASKPPYHVIGDFSAYMELVLPLAAAQRGGL
jgi:hypothetical protein